MCAALLLLTLAGISRAYNLICWYLEAAWDVSLCAVLRRLQYSLRSLRVEQRTRHKSHPPVTPGVANNCENFTLIIAVNGRHFWKLYTINMLTKHFRFCSLKLHYLLYLFETRYTIEKCMWYHLYRGHATRHIDTSYSYLFRPP